MKAGIRRVMAHIGTWPTWIGYAMIAGALAVQWTIIIYLGVGDGQPK